MRADANFSRFRLFYQAKIKEIFRPAGSGLLPALVEHACRQACRGPDRLCLRRITEQVQSRVSAKTR
jgi:hypothetical protein